MYQVELLSWSCQTSKTSVLGGREAKEECIARFSSLQRVVRQAILRNSDFVLVQSIYVSSVFSIMAHTILAKAVELPSTDHRKLQRLLQALTSLSDQAIGVVPSERGSGRIVAWKRFLPRTALEHCWGVNQLDRLRTIKMFVERIITSKMDHPVHKFFRLSDYQEEKVYLC
jgi:hypothetical protein